MDKEEFRIKLEQINYLVEQQDYKGAMNVVDSIDWRRVKNVRTLCVVGEIYAANKRYEDSKEIFLLAYHRASIGKNILYRLIEVSLRMGDVDEAMDFYEEFKEVAPNDNTHYILKYKILKAKKAPIEELIKILEEYKEREFTERWSYELAKLYYQAGEREKCLSVCNEMSLWFSEGKYVMKALELKLSLGGITPEEEEKYRKQFESDFISPEQAKELKDSEEEDIDSVEKPVSGEDSREEEKLVIESIRMDERDINNAESLQEKISKGIRDIFNNRKKEGEEEKGEDDGQEIKDEMIRDLSAQEDYSNIPALEDEDGNSRTLEKTFEETVSEYEAPKVEVPQMPDVSLPGAFSNIEEMAEEENEEPVKVNFDEINLEDSILAAATAQGIEIPEDTLIPEEKKPEQQETAEKPETEEEEELTEEDLRSAEEEFLNGPAAVEEENARIHKPAGMSTDVFQFREEIRKVLEAQGQGLEEIEKMENLDSDALKVEEEAQPLTEEEELERFIETLTPEEERNPENLIPREKKLSDEEKKLFTYLAQVPGLSEQLVDALCDVQMAAADKTSKTGNVMVMGIRESGKTRLISGLIPAICQELHLEAAKVAYVFAEQINGKDISAIVDKLSGGFLVIENANQLTAETVEQLDKAMEFRTDGLTVIIEDEKIGMRKLIAKYPKFAKKFTSMINIPIFTNDELANFARVYARENGYTIDQMGMLALYNLISENQKQDEPMNIGTVKQMVDNAITRSQGGIRRLKRNLSKKRTDYDGFVVLYEKDFN